MRRRPLPAHLVSHALTVFLRHLPLPMALVTHALAVVLRCLPPLFAHFLAHLAPLVGGHLGINCSGDSRKGCQHEQQARHPWPDEHLQKFSNLHIWIVASPERRITRPGPGLCNNLFPPSRLKKLVTIARMPNATAGLSFAP